MKKHLDVLLTLVALVGIVNGLAGGAGGRGGLGGVAPTGSTENTSNGGGGSGLPGSAKQSNPSNSTLGLGGGAGGGSGGGSSQDVGIGGSPGESADAKSVVETKNDGNSTLLLGGTSPSGPSNSSSGPSVGEGGRGRDTSDSVARGTSGAPSDSNRGPGSNPSTNGTSSGGSGRAEGRNIGPGTTSSAGIRSGGGSVLSGRTPVSGPVGSGSGIDVGSRGPGSSLAAAGRTAGASRRLLGGEIFSGLDFPSALGGSSDDTGEDERDLSASGSLRGSSGFGGGGPNGGFSADPSRFGAFGSTVAGTSIGGVGGGAGATAGGRGPLGGDQSSEEGLGFGRDFGGSGDFFTNPGSRFSGNTFSRGSSGLGGDGFYGDFGQASSGEDFNGGAGGIRGAPTGLGPFGSGSSSDFGNPPAGLGFPAGLDERPGTNGRNRGGGEEAFPGSFADQSPGAFSGSETGLSGSPGWPTRGSLNGFGSSGLDSSPALSRRIAPDSRRSQPSRFWPRLWGSGSGGRGQFGFPRVLRKPDRKLAAAAALRTLAGAAAISRLGVRIAAAIHENRRNGHRRFGGHRRGCVGRDCARQKRLHQGLTVADAILTRLPMAFSRLY